MARHFRTTRTGRVVACAAAAAAVAALVGTGIAPATAAPISAAASRPAGCAALPTASTVGRPSGLPAATVHNGTFVTSANNQVIDNLHIKGRLYVQHSGVVIKNSIIDGDDYISVNGTSNIPFRVEDSDLHKGLTITSGSTLQDVHISARSDSTLTDAFVTRADDLTIDRLLVDGLKVNSGDGTHVDGVQFLGSQRVRLTNSWIDASGSGSEAVNASVYFGRDPNGGPQSEDITFTCNHVVHAPGSYFPLRFENANGAVTVKDNTFGPIDTGQAVLASIVSPGTSSDPDPLVWSNNRYADNSLVAVPSLWQ